MGNQNIQVVKTTWGAWDKSQYTIPYWVSVEAREHNATDDTEIIVHKEETPFGTLTHTLEWLQ